MAEQENTISTNSSEIAHYTLSFTALSLKTYSVRLKMHIDMNLFCILFSCLHVIVPSKLHYDNDMHVGTVLVNNENKTAPKMCTTVLSQSTTGSNLCSKGDVPSMLTMLM